MTCKKSRITCKINVIFSLSAKCKKSTFFFVHTQTTRSMAQKLWCLFQSSWVPETILVFFLIKHTQQAESAALVSDLSPDARWLVCVASGHRHRQKWKAHKYVLHARSRRNRSKDFSGAAPLSGISTPVIRAAEYFPVSVHVSLQITAHWHWLADDDIHIPLDWGASAHGKIRCFCRHFYNIGIPIMHISAHWCYMSQVCITLHLYSTNSCMRNICLFTCNSECLTYDWQVYNKTVKMI